MLGTVAAIEEDLQGEAARALGLLADEYDPSTQRLAGNFPQAFSHLGSSEPRTR